MTEYIKFGKISTLKRYWKEYEYHNYLEAIKIKNCWRNETIIDEFDKLYIGFIPHKYLSHFQNHMTINDYSFCSDCGLGYICGYMLLYRKEKNKNTQYIELCDTLIKKQNILEQIIKHYQDKKKIILHPKETIDLSNVYWVKYYKKHYNIHTKDEYILFCEKNGLIKAVDYK